MEGPAQRTHEALMPSKSSKNIIFMNNSFPESQPQQNESDVDDSTEMCDNS